MYHNIEQLHDKLYTAAFRSVCHLLDYSAFIGIPIWQPISNHWPRVICYNFNTGKFVEKQLSAASSTRNKEY